MFCRRFLPFISQINIIYTKKLWGYEKITLANIIRRHRLSINNIVPYYCLFSMYTIMFNMMNELGWKIMSIGGFIYNISYEFSSSLIHRECPTRVKLNYYFIEEKKGIQFANSFRNFDYNLCNY